MKRGGKRCGVAAVLSLSALLMAGAGSAQAAEEGEALFNQHCAVCHQPGGIGAPGLAPALASLLGKRVSAPGGREYLPRVLLGGLSGAIVAGGEKFNGMMLPFPQLSDEQLAALSHYLLGTLNKDTLAADFAPLTAADFAAWRGKPASSAENRKLRTQLDAGGL